jgi:hypothetical protein
VVCSDFQALQEFMIKIDGQVEGLDGTTSAGQAQLKKKLKAEGWTAECVLAKFPNLVLPGPESGVPSACVATEEGEFLMGVFHETPEHLLGKSSINMANGAAGLQEMCQQLDKTEHAQENVPGLSKDLKRKNQASGLHGMLGLTGSYKPVKPSSGHIGDLP